MSSQLPKHFDCVGSLLMELDTLSVDAGLVSFDIFDTLLLRRTDSPDDLKRPVAAYVAALAQEIGIPLSASDALESRNYYEESHRDANLKQSGDREANYCSFMAESLKHLFSFHYSPDLLRRVADYEVALESSAIVVRRSIAKWINEAAARGISVLLITDFYFPSDLLWRLFQKLGLVLNIREIVSSADKLVTKASGELFRVVEAQYKVDPEKWIHVGDNPISDGRRPSSMGLRTLIIADHAERERHNKLKGLRHTAAKNPAFISRYVELLMEPLVEEKATDCHLYDLGSGDLGNILGYFCLRLAERCSELGIEHIYFSAREGYSLQNYWKIVASVLPNAMHLPASSYLYVSRLSIARASIGNGLSPLSLKASLLPQSNRSFDDVCRVFELDPASLAPFLQRVGLSLNCDLRTEENFTKVEEVLNWADFQEEVKSQGRSNLEAFENYLVQVGFFNYTRVALVDIGWLGTIPHLLSECLDHRRDQPTVYPLFLAATRGMPYEINTRLEGLVYDRQYHNYRESLLVNAKDLLEEAFRAPHPSVINYRLVRGVANPIFRGVSDEISKKEKLQDARYKSLHDGYAASAKRFASMSAVTGFSSNQLAPWIRQAVFRLFALPSERSVEQLRPEVHESDFGWDKASLGGENSNVYGARHYY